MKLIFTLLTICLGFIVLGQEDIPIPIEGRISDFDTGKKLGGVKITFKAGSSVVGTTTSASNGKYDFELTAGKSYVIEYTYPGFVTKVIRINANGIIPEDLPSGNFVPIPPIDLDMFKKRDNVDFSFLKSQAVAEFSFDKGKQALYYNVPKYNTVKKKIDEMLSKADQKAKQDDAKYNALVEDADALYDKEEYEAALEKYLQANGIKPSEPHPNDRIVTIEDLLAALKKEQLKQEMADQAYQNLLTAAQNFLDNKEYDKALDKYDEASELRPNENYPLDQIDKVYEIKKKAEQKKLYDQAIKLADNFMKQNSLEAALDKYKEASLLDPSQEYPKTQITKLESGVEAKKKEKLQKIEFDKIIAEADKLLSTEKYTEAKAKYNEALALEPGATHPTTKIKEIEETLKKIEEEKAKEASYQKFLSEAKTAFGAKEYDAAIEKYQAALGVKPQDEFATNQIEVVKKAKADALQAEKQKEIDQQFNALIDEGDALQTEEKLQEAKAKFIAAKKLKEEDLVVNEKIAAVEKLISDKLASAEKEKQIEALLSSASTKFTEEKYGEAISDYDKVLELDPANESALTKKAEAEKLKAEKESALAKQEQIAQLKSEAKTAFDGKDYPVAIEKYTAVLALDEADTEAKTKLEEAKSALAEMEAAASQDQAYIDKIASADAARDAEELDKAIALYQEAKEIKADESYPDEQITSINNKKEELAKAAALEEKNTEYTAKLTAANAAKEKELFDDAIALYTEASELKPEETEPKEQIELIKKLQEELAEQAKKDELNANYQAKIVEADAARDAEELDKAITLYQAAKEIKADESYPDEQITSINNKKEELAKTAALEEQNTEYTAKLTAAKAAKEKELFDDAIALYTEASELKPEETEPKEQIELIKKLQEELAEQAKMDELNANYQAKIVEADAARDADDLDLALGLYIEAKKIKSSETYPAEQIDEINKKKLELENAVKQGEIDEQFNEKFAAASKAKEKEQYELALMLFKEAQEIKAEDESAQVEIDEINALIEAQNAQADLEATQAAYQTKLTEAESAKADGELQNAIALFKEAKEIKSDETYPDEQIAEIENQIKEDAAAKEANALQAEYDAKMQEALAAKGEEKYPEAIALLEEAKLIKDDGGKADEEISLINALIKENELAQAEAQQSKAYNDKITAADAARDGEDYKEALILYEEAKLLNADEKYPQKQIDDINELIAEQEASQKETELNAKYTSKMEEANLAKTNESYEEAIALYTAASEIKPDEKEPRKQIDDINNILKDIADSKQEKIDDYNAVILKADEARDEGKFEKAIESYTEASALMPNETYPAEEIESINNKIAELEAQKNQAKLDEEFDGKLAAALKAREKEQYEESLLLYKEAQELKPEASEPKEGISFIEDLYAKRDAEKELLEKTAAYKAKVAEADVARDNGEVEKALATYKAAKEIKPDETYPDGEIDKLNELIAAKEAEKANKAKNQEYKNMMVKADAAFEGEDFEESILLYQAAIEIKDEERPKQQIEKAKKAIEQEAINAANQEVNAALAVADAAFTKDEYKEAIALYQDVLTLDADNAKALNKIAEAEQILDNLAAQKEQEKRNEAQYNSLIAKADGLFASKKLKEARDAYKASLQYKENDAYANDKIREISMAMRSESDKEVRAQYQKILTAADNAFNSEDLEKAKELYTRAAGINKGDPYPKSQLAKIKKMQEPKREPGELEYLGEEEEITLQEGAKLLLEAEAQRKANKEAEVQNQIDKSKVIFEEHKSTDADHRQETLEKSQELMAQKAEQDKEGDKLRQNAVDLVDQREEDLTAKSKQDALFEKAENSRTQEYVDGTYSEMKNNSLEQNKELQAKAVEIKSKENQTKETSRELLKDREDRTTKTYDLIQDQLESEASAASNDAQIAAAQQMLENIDAQEVKMYENSVDKNALLEARSEHVKQEQAKIKAQKAKDEGQNQQMLERTTELAATAQEKANESQENSDIARQQLTQKVREDEAVLSAKEKAQMEKEKAQGLSTEQLVQQSRQEIAAKKKNTEDGQVDLHKHVKEHEKIVETKNKENQQSSDDRLEKTQEILNEQNNQSERNQAKKNEEAQIKYTQIKNEVNKVNENRAEQSKANSKKALETQAYLDGLETSSVKYTETVANALGEKFPEGVSQQSFVRRDSQGLPVKIVTRRIVVKNGRGDVYIRIQSKYGTTYSKNGVSVSSTVWDKETDNGKLVKHY